MISIACFGLTLEGTDAKQTDGLFVCLLVCSCRREPICAMSNEVLGWNWISVVQQTFGRWAYSVRVCSVLDLCLGPSLVRSQVERKQLCAGGVDDGNSTGRLVASSPCGDSLQSIVRFAAVVITCQDAHTFCETAVWSNSAGAFHAPAVPEWSFGPQRTSRRQ